MTWIKTTGTEKMQSNTKRVKGTADAAGGRQKVLFPVSGVVKTCRSAQDDEYKVLHPTLFNN